MRWVVIYAGAPKLQGIMPKIMPAPGGKPNAQPTLDALGECLAPEGRATTRLLANFGTTGIAMITTAICFVVFAVLDLVLAYSCTTGARG
jgi:hypothetical protein